MIEAKQLRYETRLRSELDDIYDFIIINQINHFSIDFLREVSKHFDIKRMLWNARPWGVDETIEEHMLLWHPHLKEFWRDILTDDKYKKFYKSPNKVKTIKQVLLSVK